MPKLKLFVFFGLIASGKSTLAKAWAEARGLAWYNSDILRKELAGLSPTARRQESADQGIYTPEFTARTYQALLAAAEGELARGKSVVLDASYQRKEERDQVRELASRLGVRLYWVLCVCPEEEMKRRMEERARDPLAVSDGRWEIYLKQKERFEAPAELGPEQIVTLSTDRPVATLLEELAARLKEKTP